RVRRSTLRGEHASRPRESEGAPDHVLDREELAVRGQDSGVTQSHRAGWRLENELARVEGRVVGSHLHRHHHERGGPVQVRGAHSSGGADSVATGERGDNPFVNPRALTTGPCPGRHEHTDGERRHCRRKEAHGCPLEGEYRRFRVAIKAPEEADVIFYLAYTLAGCVLAVGFTATVRGAHA